MLRGFIASKGWHNNAVLCCAILFAAGDVAQNAFDLDLDEDDVQQVGGFQAILAVMCRVVDHSTAKPSGLFMADPLIDWALLCGSASAASLPTRPAFPSICS